MANRQRRNRTGGAAPAAPLPPRDEGTRPATRPGWQALEHVELPRPTYWPAVLALAIVFLAWSIVTSWLIAVAGAILLVVALAGWIGELQHGH
jgi:hypothetical protein